MRRLKKHIFTIDPMTGEKKSKFKDREVLPVPVTADETKHAPFIEMQRALLEIAAPELKRAFRTRNYSDALAWIALLKRSVSTAVACARTLQVVADRFQRFATDSASAQELRRQRVKTLRDYERRIERFGSITQQEEEDRSLLEAEDIAQQLANLQREIRSGSTRLARITDVVSHLDEVIDLAERAKACDPKVDAVVQTVKEIRRAEPRANVLVYTEYTDSQAALVKALKDARAGEVITMCGDDPESDRSARTARFRAEDNLILVSTDSASEGLNLHQRCHHLIHLELPFNPNRLEQRNGRIDRYGQSKTPIVGYAYLRGTFEERILLRLIAKWERQRRLLTFVPNTLGVTSPNAGEKLLKGLLDEDERLFKQRDALFDLTQPEEDGADEATQELLEEIDRSLSGFREAARANSWLAESGLNADEQVLREADQALGSGSRGEQVDLVSFVVNAVKLDGGQLTGAINDPVFKVTLPQSWTANLDDLPGYDPTTRTLRLTTDMYVTEDDAKHSVGFIGRAHPLVRRAIERVRSMFLGSSSSIEDVRVSAVAAAVVEPELLFTFLGRVASDAGRALERIIAVRVPQSGDPAFLTTPSGWMRDVIAARPIPTRDVWKTRFASWGDDAATRAADIARASFEPIASAFGAEWHARLAAERAAQRDWLQKRVDEITSASTPEPEETQTGLFDVGPRPAPAFRKSWQSVADPLERLVVFQTDRRQLPRDRVAADTVLRLYKQRVAELDALAALRPAEVVPIGILMVVPEASNAA